MGMFDTIHFDTKYSCSVCNKEIDSTQTKAFDNLLENYYVKDCVTHAEDICIIKEELFCHNCSKFTGKYVYIVVNRGILLGVADSLEEARKLLNDLNLEKIILWYHDLYKKYVKERNKKYSYLRFLENLAEWYGQRLFEKPKERRFFIWHKSYFEGAVSPVESIERFLTYENMCNGLDKLWADGHEVLEIYYPEDIKQGEEMWYVDVYQDELNKLCRLNWTWTVISKKQLEADNEKEKEQPDWVIVVDKPFSDDVVTQAIEKWLRGRNYEFKVKMIPINKAKGSGMLEKLKELDMEAEKKHAVSLEAFMEELDKEEIKDIAALIEAKRDRKKVFYYKGFYGSCIPDIEADRFIGKIEGIKKTIIYQAKTVKECEQKFRQAVSEYIKQNKKHA